MFTLLRNYQAARRIAKLTRLIELAKRADEVLMGCRMAPDTRQMLQQKRDALESQIRALHTA
jgi:hypothetical protein